MNITQKIGIAIAAILFSILLTLFNPFSGFEKTKVLYTKQGFLFLYRNVFPEYNDLMDDVLFDALHKKYPELNTWIEGEAIDYNVIPLDFYRKDRDLRLDPPPAYYGKRPILKSSGALVQWMDEPSEFLGFSIPLIILTFVWVFLFRNQPSKKGEK